MNDEKVCRTCDWYDGFTGACCNGGSEHRGDFMDMDMSCKEWERNAPFVVPQ